MFSKACFSVVKRLSKIEGNTVRKASERIANCRSRTGKVAMKNLI